MPMRDVSRLLRRESLEALSRELSMEMHRLQRRRDRVLGGIDESLRERDADRLRGELDVSPARSRRRPAKSLRRS